MEIELGKAYRLNVIKKRLWYAPWKTKILGIKFNRIFIALKQPKPALFCAAKRKCSSVKVNGERCFLGTSWEWSSLYEDKKLIDDFLVENGGDKLPEQVITHDAETYSSSRHCADISAGRFETKKYDYRPICSRD